MRKVAEGRFSVATMNTFNFALAGVSSSDFAAIRRREHKLKRTWIAQQIEAMGHPDVICLQEVWSRQPLEDLLSIRGYGRLKDYQVLIDPDESPGSTTAILSRREVVSCEFVRQIPQQTLEAFPHATAIAKRFLRPVTIAQIKFGPNLVVEVWSVHLKSKRPLFASEQEVRDSYTFADGQARSLLVRTIEALGLRHLYLSRQNEASRPTLILGDINDGPYSVTSAIICGPSPKPCYEIGCAEKLWQEKLHDAAMAQVRTCDVSATYTYVFDGSHDRLDQIFVSDQLWGDNPKCVARVRYVRTFNDHLVDTNRLGRNPAASDHGLLVAVLETNPAEDHIASTAQVV